MLLRLEGGSAGRVEFFFRGFGGFIGVLCGWSAWGMVMLGLEGGFGGRLEFFEGFWGLEWVLGGFLGCCVGGMYGVCRYLCDFWRFEECAFNVHRISKLNLRQFCNIPSICSVY
ncbi:hypothetical protein KM043_001108 [Ampulex compressa]|nr:hypothetical protein KM043_001108 [Ampulex compressa]